MISLAEMTVKMAFLVGGQLDVEYCGENHQPVRGDVQQMHIDFALDPLVDYPTDFDDFTKKALQPMADKFVSHLMERRIHKTFDLSLETKGYESSREHFNGLSLRGIVNRHHIVWLDTGGAREVELYRFDVLFQPEPQA